VKPQISHITWFLGYSLKITHNFDNTFLVIKEETMKKIVTIYKITDTEKQDEKSLKYWKSKSIKAKIDAINQLRRFYCELKGLNPDEQRLQRVFRITQLSQS